MTFSEFLEWLEFVHLEDHRETKLDWYLAQVAAEVRRSYSEKRIYTKDLLIKFGPVVEEPKKRAQDSKKIWAEFLKVDANKN